MASNGPNGDKAEAAERRKRKAERLADDPSVQKVQKKIKIKQEPPDPKTEIANSVSDGGVDGQAEQNAASESEGEDDEDSDGSESDDGSESSSSSDTDAESSSESEEEEEEDQEPEQPDTEPVQPTAAPVEPSEMGIRPPSSNSALPSERNSQRMNTYYDILARLELSDPVAKTAIDSIASEYFDQIFPTAALELARQRAHRSEQLKRRDFGEGQAGKIWKAILKILSSKIAVWLEDVSKEGGTMQSAIDVVSREARQRKKPNLASTGRRPEAEEQHTSSIENPQPTPIQTEHAPAGGKDQTAAPANAQRPPGYPFQVDDSTTPSVAPSAASNIHVPPEGRSLSGESSKASKPSKFKRRDKTPAKDAFQFYGRHVEAAVKSAPGILGKGIWNRSHHVWNQLLAAERQEWEALFSHYKIQGEVFSLTNVPAEILLKDHEILGKIKRLDASSKTPPPRSKAPGAATSSKQFNPPRGPAAMNVYGSSGGRSVDSYRPTRYSALGMEVSPR